jgi:LytS/YehU family sensor histidine kinase
MFLWCEYVEGIAYSWDWRSVGYILDGLLTTSLVVGVCAYHSYSRAAADALMRSRIERTRLDAERQRARLQLLRAQIEPHFLFNTLSVVRALAKNDRAATVTMLDHLIRYFGAALPPLRAGEVPLAKEVELVEAYLAIYRARMGTRLAYEVCVPEDLGRLMIPSMMLLTLVENALKHGLSQVAQGGFIRVSAARERNTLLLQVADSGRGLDARQGHGTGLANIRQRLLMAYGPQAILTLKVAVPRGAVASVSMPVH